MNARGYAGRKPWPSALVVAVGLLLMAVLAACGAVPATTPTPGTDDDDATPGQTDNTAGLTRTEERGDAAVGASAPTLSDYQTYAWVGTIVEGELEGPHVEIQRGCDTWVLLPENDEVEKKLRDNIGKKLTVWGEVSYDPSIYMKQTIKVSSAHAEGDIVIDLYVPDYPCPGETEPGQPLPADAGYGYYYGGIDLQDGEIAAIGKLVQDGDRWYLETAAGKILLTGNVKPVEIGGGEVPPVARDMPMPEDCVLVDPDTSVSSREAEGSGGGVSYGCATPGVAPSGEPGVDDDWDTTGYVGPVSCKPATDDTLVVGTWSVQGGDLAIDVRYSQPWGEYVCEYPEPSYPVEPVPAPDQSMGVVYGHLEVGPLCPVEPCEGQDPRELFAGKVLELSAGDGSEAIKIELTPDGWFKQQVPAGGYTLSMPDCPWMGCETAFPVAVRAAYDHVDELTIRIDTGIR